MASDTTIIDAVKFLLRDHPEQPMSLDEIQGHLPRYGRTQLRSASGNAARDYANYFRIGDAEFMFSERKHLQYHDGRMNSCRTCGQNIPNKTDEVTLNEEPPDVLDEVSVIEEETSASTDAVTQLVYALRDVADILEDRTHE